MKSFEEIPDLSKQSEEYQAHEELIQGIRALLAGCNNLIFRTIQNGQRRVPTQSGKLPAPKSIEREGHINCMGLQILVHHLAMEAFCRDQDDQEAARLREPLQRIAAVRASILQFRRRKQAVDLLSVVQEIDEGVAQADPRAECPALTPFLMKPETAISRLKKVAMWGKFEDPNLLLNLNALFREDHHVLHSVCLAFIENGMHVEVERILQARSRELHPGFNGDLAPLFQDDLNVFTVYIIALVESGTKRALSWFKRPRYEALLRSPEHMDLIEKYIAALRHQGMFDAALAYLEELRDKHKIVTDRLRVQYFMARTGDRSILPKKQ